MSGPWIQQKNVYFPGFVNVTDDERGSGTWPGPIVSGCREEAVAVVRAVVGVSALRLRAVEQERRHLVRRGRALRHQVGLLLQVRGCTSWGRTSMLCGSFGDLFTNVTVVPDLDREPVREVAERGRIVAEAHVDGLRRRLRRGRLRLRLRPACVDTLERRCLHLRRAQRHRAPGRLDRDGRLHARVDRADQLERAGLRERVRVGRPASRSGRCPATRSRRSTSPRPAIVFGPNGPNAWPL